MTSAEVGRAPRRPPVERLREGLATAAQFVPAAWHGRRERGDFADVETYVTFVGYPRSGHSLLGWLLDAHRHTLIAPELDALRYVTLRFGRDQLFHLIRRRSEEVRRERGEARGERYSYAVPGQWQGRFEQLRVIGDKKGGGSSLRLRNRPWLLDRLRDTVGARLVFVHVVRNPWDNVATISRRTELPLDTAIARYRAMAGAVAELREAIPDEDWYETQHEDVIEDPRRELSRLCETLGLDAPQDYLDACASIVFAAQRRSRDQVSWTPAQVEAVRQATETVPFLAGYSFEGR